MASDYEDLVAALNDPEPIVRELTINQIAAAAVVTQGGGMVTLLIEATTHGDAAVSKRALEGLAEIEDDG